MSMKESIHRLAKAEVDSGSAHSFEEALDSLNRLKLNVYVGEEIVGSRSIQAALATIINAGSRTFLGGVKVVTTSNYQFSIPWSSSNNLIDLVTEYGAEVDDKTSAEHPSIIVGTYTGKIVGSCIMQVTFDKWSGGVIPFGDQRLSERDTFPVAGVLAGAIAVSEAVQSAWASNAIAGRRKIITSLWTPGDEKNVTNEPKEFLNLPSKLWVLGLGHLGQAVLWTLGFLPYLHPEEVNLTLQDFDTIGPANLSTGLLITPESYNRKKTRWIAEICESRGFKTIICERPFNSKWKFYTGDPDILLCLPDNLPTRRALDSVQFKFAIEAGLGSTFDAYTRFTMHSFPGSRTPADLWGDQRVKNLEKLLSKPAYAELKKQGLDECGIVELAGVAVGAPFVGTVVACFVVSEIIRLINGEHLYDVVDGDLKSLKYLTAVKKQVIAPLHNYGITQSTPI